MQFGRKINTEESRNKAPLQLRVTQIVTEQRKNGEHLSATRTQSPANESHLKHLRVGLTDTNQGSIRRKAGHEHSLQSSLRTTPLASLQSSRNTPKYTLSRCFNRSMNESLFSDINRHSSQNNPYFALYFKPKQVDKKEINSFLSKGDSRNTPARFMQMIPVQAHKRTLKIQIEQVEKDLQLIVENNYEKLNNDFELAKRNRNNRNQRLKQSILKASDEGWNWKTPDYTPIDHKAVHFE